MKCDKNFRLKHTEQAQALLNQLTLEEKVSLMSGNMPLERILAEARISTEKHYNYIPSSAGGLREHNIPPILFCDGSRGVVCGTGKAPVFPFPCSEALHSTQSSKKRSEKQLPAKYVPTEAISSAAYVSISPIIPDGEEVRKLMERTPFIWERCLAVLGSLATADNFGDHGSSQVFPAYTVTPLDGITKSASDCEVIYYGGSNLSHAKELAASADATVIIAGYNYNDEGEYTTQNSDETYTGARGGDRYDLGLHKDEIRLIQEVGTVTSNAIVVLIGGSTITTKEWQDNAGAVLMVYYPGMEGGTAIGEILFGDTNPSGKLPFVIPNSQDDLPAINWEIDTHYYHYYHGYTKLEKENISPAFPFGFRLSYTEFEITDARFSVAGGVLSASCRVKNTGSREGTQVIQLYIGFSHSKIDRPVKLLKGFTRISLDRYRFPSPGNLYQSIVFLTP